MCDPTSVPLTRSGTGRQILEVEAPTTTAPHLAMRGRWRDLRPVLLGVADGIQNGDLSC